MVDYSMSHEDEVTENLGRVLELVKKRGMFNYPEETAKMLYYLAKAAVPAMRMLNKEIPANPDIIPEEVARSKQTLKEADAIWRDALSSVFPN